MKEYELWTREDYDSQIVEVIVKDVESNEDVAVVKFSMSLWDQLFKLARKEEGQGFEP